MLSARWRSLPLLLAVSTPAAASEWAAGGGYLGESIAHPGLVASVERRIHPDAAPHIAIIAADLGVWWHPRAQWAPHADVRAGWRYDRGRGYSAELTVGVGYLHSFIAAETANFRNTGRPHLVVPVDIGLFGWTLGPEAAAPLRLATSVRVVWQYPVNTHAVVHPVLAITLARPF